MDQQAEKMLDSIFESLLVAMSVAIGAMLHARLGWTAVAGAVVFALARAVALGMAAWRVRRASRVRAVEAR